jgi:glycosyltransferase involved in cell wall biosynthesis
MEVVRSLNIKSVFTPRDFWPMCGLKHRVCRTDGSTCDRIELSKCGTCLLGEQWGEVRAAELAAHEARRPAPPETLGQTWKRLYKHRYDATRGLTGRRPLAMLHATKVSLREAKWKAEEQFHEKFGDSIERRSELFAQRMRDLDLLIAPSEYMRDQYIAHFGLSPAKAIYSATSRDTSRAAVNRKSASAALRVGFIGSLAREDGFLSLLDAFLSAAACNERLELRAHLKCGPSGREALETLRSQVVANGMEGRVHLMEEGDVTRVHEALSEIDLLVVPTLGLGNPPVELEWAAYHGVAVLTSDSAGLAEFCRVNGYGRTFARGDVNALTLQLASLAAGEAQLDGYAGAPLKFKSPTYEAEKLVLTYHELLYGKYKAPSKEQQAAERTGPLPEPTA